MPQAPALRDTGESSSVAKLVTLHHRWRGWAWVAVGSAIGLAVYAGVDVNLFERVTGTAATLSIIPVVVLLGLVLAGLVVVIVDTSRLHRADAAVRVQAKGSVSYHPLYAHAYRSRTGAEVNWGSQVPLGQPFSVRDPLWARGTGRKLIDGDGSAIPDIVAGLFFDAVALLLPYVIVVPSVT